MTRPLKWKKGALSIHPNQEISQILDKLGVNQFGFVPLSTPVSYHHYQNWLKKGLHGDMVYMEDAKQVRKHPSENFSGMKSLIVFSHDYFPIDQRLKQGHFESLKVAHYARSKDYHLWFRQKLEDISTQLKKRFPDQQFITFTDAVPLLERDYATQAGLGWIGKNTCVIRRGQGSLFFIGEILTSLELSSEGSPSQDFCGSCTACIDICPTEALKDKVLDANKCIAYWNIENKDIPPVEIREKMAGWFFGCDLCQTICPWNLKLFKSDADFIQHSKKSPQMIEELKTILNTSNKKLMARLANSPLSRAGGRGLKRNALLVISHHNIHELADLVRGFSDHEYLGELAQWVLQQLSPS